MAKVMKSEVDGRHPASHYLVVEDPEKPSTWHLRVKNVSGENDHGLMGNAWAALHSGFRGNKYEGPNKQAAIEKLIALYKSEKMELPSGKEFESETVIAFGASVKALGDGKIGGYLVQFTSDDDPDLEQEYFTKDTDFGDPKPIPVYGTVYYQHGLDQKMGKRRLGTASHKLDDFGVWAEAQLDLRDKYEQFIYQMIEQKKMGWSSGTASHLVERQVTGKSTWIKTWPLGLDDTLTPVPAEPRNVVMPLKSWQPIDLFGSITLADRIAATNVDLKTLQADLSELIAGIDRPLSETKRKELNDLLELCSGLDAVRSDIKELLAKPQAAGLVGPRLLKYQMDAARKRLAAKHLIEE